MIGPLEAYDQGYIDGFNNADLPKFWTGQKGWFRNYLLGRTDGKGDFAAAPLVPTGILNLPTYIPCDGRPLPREQYPALYEILETKRQKVLDANANR